jgi:hypothetical protein
MLEQNPVDIIREQLRRLALNRGRLDPDTS